MDAAILQRLADLDSVVNDIIIETETVQSGFETYISRESRAYRDKAQQINKDWEQSIETRKKLELEADRVQNTIIEYEKKLADLNKTVFLREMESSKTQLELASKNCEALRSKRDKLQQQLEQKILRFEEQRMTHEENREKDVLELEALNKKTRLAIVGVGEDLIQFSFKSISLEDPERTYYFILHLPESGNYEVTECRPELPQMSAHLDQLNKDRDIYSFVKRMRLSFVESSKPE